MGDGTFFGRLAALSPFCIIDGTLYQISDRESTGDALLIGHQRFALVPSGTVVDFEAFERQRQDAEITAFQQNYLADAVRRQLNAHAVFGDGRNAVKALEFILFEAMPLMIDTAQDLGQLLGVEIKSQTGREVIEGLVATELSTIAARDVHLDIATVRSALRKSLEQGEVARASSRQADGTPCLSTALEFPRVLVANGLVYPLIDGSPGNGPEISFGGHTYRTKSRWRVDDVEQTHANLLQSAWKAEALTHLDAQLEELVKQDRERRTALDHFRQRERFNYGNLGYYREGEKFYVYWETPPFAMQNPLRTTVYHPFPATQIAIRVNASSGEVHIGEPCVYGAMIHPFLGDWKTPKQRICILSERDTPSTPEGLVRRLSIAINTFMNGLTTESLSQHGTLSEDAKYFGRPLHDSLKPGGEFSRPDAVAKGYLITNEWDLKARELHVPQG